MTTDRAAFEAALGEYMMSFRRSANPVTYDEAVARRSDLLALYDALAAEAEAMALVMSHEGAIERLTAERDALAKRATAAEYRLEDRWANPEEIGEREAYIRTLKTENEQLRAALELGLGFVAAHDSQMPQSKLALMARMRATLAPRETTREEK